MHQIGFDVGGTFTDLVVADGHTGIHTLKVLSSITQSGVHASNSLKKTPEQFGQKAASEITGIIDVMLEEVGKANGDGMTQLADAQLWGWRTWYRHCSSQPFSDSFPETERAGAVFVFLVWPKATGDVSPLKEQHVCFERG